MTARVFAPGDLVRARGREWVTLPSPDPEWMRLRPLLGSEADVQLLNPSLEREPIEPATFRFPDLGDIATQDAADLLDDALRLSLRRGAGPFRSTGHLSFEPRAYQLVPLLMALRLNPIRLLIADDVGIGKTIEAGLILRELFDRGEIDRFSILCAPQLVEQWTGELLKKFDFEAVAVTAASAARLERGLTMSQTIFEAYPFTVVSLDYIKADKRREGFASACPQFVIVDEAHTCVGSHAGRHQRFDLLTRLAKDSRRHMVMLTATPHSGDEEAFDRLLSLLDPFFAQGDKTDQKYRERLAKHFVQRRRIDITGKDWGEERSFRPHETSELAYRFNRPHQKFHDAVLDYCCGVVTGAGESLQQRRMAFWSTLALMRCVGSSPAAAASALRNQMMPDQERLASSILDNDDEVDAEDVEPTAVITREGTLGALIRQSEELCRGEDPKLEALVSLLKPLLSDGANPVVFCRFIATSEYVKNQLEKAFPKIHIEAVSGKLTPEERRARVDSMGEYEQRILVATDCLSEGINLQALFDSVIHYDLSWNPTRHQQREGRVDRFGQSAALVRSVLLFSSDSAIDGAVLDVILRKAEAIRKATGVTVPLPEDQGAVSGALMNAVLLRRKDVNLQMAFDFNLEKEARAFDVHWRNVEEGERKSRTRYAQNTLKPEEVIEQWRRQREILGGPKEVQRFVTRAMSRLNAALQFDKTGRAQAHLHALPVSVRDRLRARGLDGTISIVFEEPPPQKAQVVTRNHPLCATLAETLIEGALDPEMSADPAVRRIGRIGAWLSPEVKTVTNVVLLRLRYKLLMHGADRRERFLLVEEAEAVAYSSDAQALIATDEAARRDLEVRATGNLADVARDRMLGNALGTLETALGSIVANHVRIRAERLAEDHAQVRQAGINVPRVTVEAVLPPDVVGLFVLVPGAL